MQNCITNSSDLRAENRFRLLQIIRHYGATVNRTKLAEYSGLSQATLTKLCGELSDNGIIQCSFEDNNGRGRPLSSYTLSPDAAHAVLVSVTIDKITFELIDYSGKTLESLDICFESQIPLQQKLMDNISVGIDKILIKTDASLLKHISVSFPGSTDSETGMFIWSSALQIANLPIGKKLEEQFNVPVSVDNDCNYISHSLYIEHGEILGNSFAAVNVTYNVGMGLYLNGEPVKGAGSSTLEFGHLMHERNGALCSCGIHGCIEAYAATYAVLRRALNQDQATTALISQVHPDKINNLIELAKKGDRNALAAFEAAGSAIGTGVNTLFAMFNPMPIALIGYSKDAWELMLEKIMESVRFASMERQDYSQLIHCFENSEKLILGGLANVSINAMDRSFASSPASRFVSLH